ncbi:MAG: phytoene/squalene synthase family protein [Candidatus Omnitrophica bacterium]|nr:phytoene/squalene synthase family protein [Candidatus Omnitrophota bacterium]MDD5661252.1 phytoene/squalene synthase family protein [Candidatus Omnitrophota bacterium]
MDKELLSGFKEAKRITKKFAKTFYLASLFLPKDRKYAGYSVYALCRLSDEAVDNSAICNQTDILLGLEEKISAAYSGCKLNEPLLAAFRETVKKYKIPKECFDELIEGMRMDLKIKRYPDFSALYKYCYRVAGVVGLIMIKIFGYKDASCRDYGIKLGIAMQLTNILRDINEDIGRGRIYLPQDEMLKFNVSESQLIKGLNNEGFKNLMRFQIERCRKYYEESSAGIKLIDSRLSRLVVMVMKETYCGILDEIKKNNYDIFSKRVFVSKSRKIAIISKILWERKYL